MVRPLVIGALCAGLTAGLPAGQTPPIPSGVISGVVTDELNRPMPGVTVSAFRLSESGQLLEPDSGNNPFTARGAWARGAIQKETDDLGEFRLWPLEASQYVVAVVVNRVTSHVDENLNGCVPPYPGDLFAFVPVVRADPVEWLTDASRRYLFRTGSGLTSPNESSVGEHGYVTTFAPRATDLPDARRVTLTDKQVEAGVDIQLQLRPAVRVTGRIVGTQLPARFDVELTSLRGGARTKTAADGSFVFLNNPVGSYALVSLGTSSDCDYIGNYGPRYQGRAEVTVESRDQNHFTLTVGPQTSVQRGPTQAPPIERMGDAGTVEGVVTADDGQPLDRVRVRVTSVALPKGATAVTGRNGRFVVANLPPDAFTLTVSRAGFVDQIYGQRRRGGEGTLIQLGAGQRFTAGVVMPRPGVIGGVVRNERGAPMPGVSVCCHVDSWTDADDRGQYRLWPVPAGDRTVFAYDARGRGVLRGYLRTYYPGVTDEALAGKVHVNPGAVRAVNIDVRPAVAVPGAPLTVRVRSADGWVGTSASVYLNGDYRGVQRAVPAGEPPTSDLVATFSSVPAGKHVVQVNPESTWFGSAETVTDGKTPSSVTIEFARKPSVSVVVALEGPGQSARGFMWTLFRVGDSPAWNSPVLSRGGSWIDLDAAGRATLHDMRPGRYVLQIDPDGTWIAGSVRLAGRDVLDEPFTLEPGSTNELLATFTKRSTSLEGIVRDGAGRLTASADVLIFSADRRFWTPGSRRIRLVRPRSNGFYEATRLPAGEYAVVAMGEVDPDSVNPDLLHSLLSSAPRVTLVDDSKQKLSLRVR